MAFLICQYHKWNLEALASKKEAGYDQLELNIVADNERVISLYRSLGFEEYGRNPRGFKSRITGYQEVVYMLLKLKENL